MARLRSDFWVSAHLRRLDGAGISAVQRKRGAAEAGAVFVKVDRLDGTADLYGPAAQAVFEEARPSERLFSPLMSAAESPDIEARLAREARFDTDLWIIEIDDREGRHLLDLAKEV